MPDLAELVATVLKPLERSYCYCYGEDRATNERTHQEAIAAVHRLHSLLLGAEEFYKAHEVVERGIIDFDLHAAAVERLRAAQAAMQAALATPEEPSHD